ncbi:DUF4136 domain-containing protein [Hymenobacter sp. BT507]|uniref:DUF4136 domain-containing protein n=1 Tax=Hymenobacter citatus TaxID=2763506 RepID=A0ABR7MHX9_9BACT|nr:DUF4136 domain-containing protein [Hymenobacter citatus]MBC6610696.1 DUF4136 domain-containing protein [Hymenobacter citatus]
MKKLLPLLLVLAACAPSAQVTAVDQMAGTDFTAYHTYNFPAADARNEAGYQVMSPTLPVWQAAIARELEKRGYRRAPQPDVWVHVGVVVADKVQTRETQIWEAPPYVGQHRYGWQSQQVPVRAYREGTTTVDVVDAARNTLVWQGNVAGALTKKPNRQVEQINNSVAELFGRYPVPAP